MDLKSRPECLAPVCGICVWWKR